MTNNYEKYIPENIKNSNELETTVTIYGNIIRIDLANNDITPDNILQLRNMGYVRIRQDDISWGLDIK